MSKSIVLAKELKAEARKSDTILGRSMYTKLCELIKIMNYEEMKDGTYANVKEKNRRTVCKL